MLSPKFDPSKAKAALLYVAKRLEERSCERYADLYKLLKTLYFADKMHLSKFARSIDGDFFVAMSHGPVPSKKYDMIKIVRGDSYFRDDRERKGLSSLFTVRDNKIVEPHTEPDMDELSESDVFCLDKALELTSDKVFWELKSLSHDSAWKDAEENESMSTEKIALAGGADSSIIELLRLQIENENFFTH